MASNSFGNIFRITTWGESHGKAVGVVIDGCPAGLEIDEQYINESLLSRAPGNSPYTSPRKEPDKAEILSGLFEGKTLGSPISIIIRNLDVDSSKYDDVKNKLRPGHANYTYLQKYGIFDHRGSGRASARETVCRVAAGAIAKKILDMHNIHIAAYIKQIGNICAEIETIDIKDIKKAISKSPINCPCSKSTIAMADLIEATKKSGDSLGGIVEFVISPVIAGLGDPIYEKLEANLAKAMLSLPATKGFEIGSGFEGSALNGSQHNDGFIQKDGQIFTSTNNSGGILGGISNGMPIIGRVAFKPTSGIMKPQQSVDTNGKETIVQLPEGSKQDPCVAIRAVPIVEAMAALVLVDALLSNKSARL